MLFTLRRKMPPAPPDHRCLAVLSSTGVRCGNAGRVFYETVRLCGTHANSMRVRDRIEMGLTEGEMLLEVRNKNADAVEKFEQAQRRNERAVERNRVNEQVRRQTQAMLDDPEWTRLNVERNVVITQMNDELIDHHTRQRLHGDWLHVNGLMIQRGRVIIAALAAGDPVPPAAPAAPRAPIFVQPLAQFAADNQNVHRADSVKMVTETVERVLKIAVPKDYKWSTKHVSKTVGEIITECHLQPNTCVQFMNRYLAHENIYNLGMGIYGRVMDGVWQFIKNSEHKEDLCKILKSELKDNIGMCLQGNLTRICNVLAGYLEGIGSQETPVERLGREMPKLMEIEDDEKRVEAAKKVLSDVGLPEAEWGAWLEAVA